MDDIVDVAIPVDAETAATLADPRNHAAAGRLITRTLRPRAGRSPLARALAEVQAAARTAGLTEDEVDAELSVYNAERRGPSGPD